MRRRLAARGVVRKVGAARDALVREGEQRTRARDQQVRAQLDLVAAHQHRRHVPHCQPRPPRLIRARAWLLLQKTPPPPPPSRAVAAPLERLGVRLVRRQVRDAAAERADRRLEHPSVTAGLGRLDPLGALGRRREHILGRLQPQALVGAAGALCQLAAALQLARLANGHDAPDGRASGAPCLDAVARYAHAANCGIARLQQTLGVGKEERDSVRRGAWNLDYRLCIAAHPHAGALQALVAALNAAVIAGECAHITGHRKDAAQREVRAQLRVAPHIWCRANLQDAAANLSRGSRGGYPLATLGSEPAAACVASSSQTRRPHSRANSPPTTSACKLRNAN